MADDLTFGVKLGGDSSTMVSETKAAQTEIENLKTSIDELSASTAKQAGMTEMYTTATGEQTASLEVAQKSFRDLQAQANAAAQASMAASDAAKDKAWALANGYQVVGDEMVKTGGKAVESMEKTAFATHRAQQELVVLGREAARGNFSRMAGSASILLQGLSPLALGIAGVTAAVAAAGYAWWEFAKDAEEATTGVADAFAEDSKKVTDKLNDEIGLLKQRAALAGIGIIGETDAAARDLTLMHVKIMALAEDIKAGTLDWNQQIIAVQELNKTVTDYNGMVNAQAEKQAAQEQLKTVTHPKKDGGVKLLAEARKLDDEMTAQHEDAFTKWVEKWKAMEDKLIAAHLYGTKEREQHEAAYTSFVNAENDKRNAAADKHLAAQLTSEDAYFAKLAAAADQSNNSAGAREEKRFADENIVFQKHMEQMTHGRKLEADEVEKWQTGIDNVLKAHEIKQQEIHAIEIQNENAYFLSIQQAADRNATTAAAREDRRFQAEMANWEKQHNLAKKNYDYSLEDEKRFQDLKAQLIAEYQNGTLVTSQTFGMNMEQFQKEDGLQQTRTMASGLEMMTAVGAQKHRELFEINKIAALSKATIAGIDAVQESYAFGAAWGGPVGGAAMAAIAFAATAGNLDAINSTQFGGGGPSAGGGGVPSMATNPGVPVSVQNPNQNPNGSGGVAAQAPTQINLTIQGANNPNQPQFTYNQIVNDLVPLLNQAGKNGVTINVTSAN